MRDFALSSFKRCVVVPMIPKVPTIVLLPSFQFIFLLYEICHFHSYFICMYCMSVFFACVVCHFRHMSFSFFFYLHVLCCHKPFLNNLIAGWNTVSVYLCMHGRVLTRTVRQATTKGA
jgi:hypothetical protein